jgi:hypothetical protein
MPGYSDLSGIFYVQQQYLADLSALAQTQGSSAAAGYISQLRRDLSSAYVAYAAASPSADAILSKQQDMLQIINNENNRLTQKMQTVDSSLYGQRRMAHFAGSYSKKYYAQIKILFVVIILLLIYLALTYIDNFIPVPTTVWVIVVLLFGGTGLLIIIFTIRDINQRYNMDFDKLDTYAPSESDARGGNGNANYQGRGLSNLLCVGESCCPAGNTKGSVWNIELQQCISTDASVGQTVPATQQGFTGMQVAPYEPSEITSYTKIQ